MVPEGRTGVNGAFWIYVALVICLLLFGSFLFLRHYVQDYSDPVGFVRRAIAWSEQGDHSDRAPLYPIILYGLMMLMGRDWVFISNLPFVLLMFGLLAALTARVSRDGRGESGCRSWALLAGLFACCLFFSVRRYALLQLINPYREVPAFSGLLLAVVLCRRGWRTRRNWLLLLAGLVLGATTSIRETSLLLIIPLGLWLLGEMVADRRFRPVLLSSLIAGLVIGLLPLLHKNYTYSGRALVPAYSAGRVQTYEVTGDWDIPVPGMSLRHFSGVAPFAVRRTRQDYGYAGVLAFIFGIGLAVKRRNRSVLLLILPSFLLYFIFYSFYRIYMRRYVMSGELFGVIIMAYGAAGGLELLSRVLKRWWNYAPAVLRVAAASGMIIWTGAEVLPRLSPDDGRTKVWHLATLREELREKIQSPAFFLGHRHFCYRLAWLLEEDFFEYTLHFHQDRTVYGSLDERLRSQGEYTVSKFSTGNYYIDESDFTLAANWLQRVPVLNFRELSVPFERYGRPLAGFIYQVRPWSETRVELKAETPRPDPALLMLDLKRPWDYPGRTFLFGREFPGGETIDLENTVQFLELRGDPGGEFFRFIIESDRGLPPEPYWRLIGLNEEIRLSFGMGADHWAWNFASEDLYPNATIRRDSGQLYDRGTLRLPSFADAGHEVLAELRFEFIQEHPHWLSRRHYLEVEAGEWSGRWALPPRRQQKRVVVPLGPGRDRLSIVPVTLRTTLPSPETQHTREFRNLCPRDGFVKLYDARLFAWRPPESYPLETDLGAPEDGFFSPVGFFGRERSGSHTGRWSSERGVLRLRPPPSERPLRLTWRVLPLRPDQDRIRPVFTVNEYTLPEDEIRLEMSPSIWTYQAELPPGVLKPGEWNRIQVEAPTWSPADTIGSRDTRRLGVFVESITIAEIP